MPGARSKPDDRTPLPDGTPMLTIPRPPRSADSELGLEVNGLSVGVEKAAMDGRMGRIGSRLIPMPVPQYPSVAQLVEKEDAEVAHLLKSLTQVRVTAIGIDDDNRADLKKRAQKVRDELDSKGWERIVNAQKGSAT